MQLLGQLQLCRRLRSLRPSARWVQGFDDEHQGPQAAHMLVQLPCACQAGKPPRQALQPSNFLLSPPYRISARLCEPGDARECTSSACGMYMNVANTCSADSRGRTHLQQVALLPLQGVAAPLFHALTIEEVRPHRITAQWKNEMSTGLSMWLACARFAVWSGKAFGAL